MTFASPLVSFTPLIQSPEHNLIRITRTHTITEDLNFIAGGQYKGIIINRLTSDYEPLENCLHWKFSVWLSDDDKNLKQEIRSFRFCFYPKITSSNVQSEVTQQFIKNLFVVFPKDYASFFKLALKLMLDGFDELQAIDIDLKFAEKDEAISRPDAKEYENDAEIENVTIGHIQDVLEHAFPNGLSVEMIADSLRCSEIEIENYLAELEKADIAAKVPNQNVWIRVDSFSVPESNYYVQSKHHPTVAIITCLFVEKQSVDAIIENSSTLHKYSKAGDSNVYTIGCIGKHHVVATKLALIGDSREATTSAGSITTRLLGSFQHVDHVIIVGVGGGVPHFTDFKKHVRLGDVVVSHASMADTKLTSSESDNTYIYAHNFVVNRDTEKAEGFATHNWKPKSNVLADVVRNRDSKFDDCWNKTIRELIEKLNETSKSNDFDFSRPSNESDVLTVQIAPNNFVVFPHPNAERNFPEIHVGPVGAMISLRKPTLPKPDSHLPLINGLSKKENVTPTVSNLQSDKTDETLKLNEKPEADLNQITTEEENELNWLQTNAQLRNKFVAENHLKAVDAGFDSVIAAVTGSQIDSWVLVRGIADYQQGSTRVGKLWQPYASVNAAALVKTILQNLPAS